MKSARFYSQVWAVRFQQNAVVAHPLLPTLLHNHGKITKKLLLLLGAVTSPALVINGFPASMSSLEGNGTAESPASTLYSGPVQE